MAMKFSDNVKISNNVKLGSVEKINQTHEINSSNNINVTSQEIKPVKVEEISLDSIFSSNNKEETPSIETNVDTKVTTSSFNKIGADKPISVNTNTVTNINNNNLTSTTSTNTTDTSSRISNIGGNGLSSYGINEENISRNEEKMETIQKTQSLGSSNNESQRIDNGTTTTPKSTMNSGNMATNNGSVKTPTMGSVSTQSSSSHNRTGSTSNGVEIRRANRPQKTAQVSENEEETINREPTIQTTNASSSSSSLFIDDATYDMLDLSTIDTTMITEADLMSLVGQMSYDQYNDFIPSIQEYYASQNEYLNGILNGTDEFIGIQPLYNHMMNFELNYETNPSGITTGSIEMAEDELERMITNSIYEYQYEGEDFGLFNGTGIDEYEFLDMTYEEQRAFVMAHDQNVIEQLEIVEEYKTIINGIILSDPIFIENEITSYDELMELREEYSQLVPQLQLGITLNEQNSSSARYDYLYYLNEYENFEFPVEFTDEQLESVREDSWNGNASDYRDLAMQTYLERQVDPLESAVEYGSNVIESASSALSRGRDFIGDMWNDPLSTISNTFNEATTTVGNIVEDPAAALAQAGYTIMTGSTNEIYDYSIYHERHPEISPLSYVYMLREIHPDGDYEVTGLPGNIETIAEITDSFPTIAKTYEYLYSEHPEDLDDFLQSCDYELLQLQAQIEAQKFLEGLGQNHNDISAAIMNEFSITGQGLYDGLHSFEEGVWYTAEAIYSGVTGNENRDQSLEELKRMYIIQALYGTSDRERMGLIYQDENGNYVNADPTSIIDYTIDYSGAGLQHTYQVSQGIGNMLPSVLLSTACPIAGSVALGISAGGNAYHGAMVGGHDYISSLIYGIATGASETITEKIMGGLPGLSEVQVTSLRTYIRSMGREGTQEMFQGLIDGLLFQTLILHEELPSTLDGWIDFAADIGMQGIYGAATAGVMNAPSLGISTINVARLNNTLTAAGFSQENIQNAIANIRNELNVNTAEMNNTEVLAQYGQAVYLDLMMSQMSVPSEQYQAIVESVRDAKIENALTQRESRRIAELSDIEIRNAYANNINQIAALTQKGINLEVATAMILSNTQLSIEQAQVLSKMLIHDPTLTIDDVSIETIDKIVEERNNALQSNMEAQQAQLSNLEVQEIINETAEINSSLENIFSNVDNLENMKEFKTALRDIRNITVENLPEGYTSVEEYKIFVINEIINSEEFSQMNNNHIFELCKDPIMFHELLSTGRVEDLFVKNYLKNSSLNDILINVPTEDVIALFSTEGMQSFFQNLSPSELGGILGSLNKTVSSDYNTLDIFVNLLCNMNLEELTEFKKAYYSNTLQTLFDENVNSPNVINFYNHLVHDIFTMENASNINMLQNLRGSLIPFGAYSITDSILKTMHKSIETSLANIQSNIFSSVVCGEGINLVNSYGSYRCQVDGDGYYNVSYTIDGVEQTQVVRGYGNTIDLTSILNESETINAILSNQFSLDSINVNELRNSMILNQSNGVVQGINYISYELNGQEYNKIISALSNLEIDLGSRFDDIQSFTLRNVIPVGRLNQTLTTSDKNNIYRVDYSMNGTQQSFYITPTNQFNNDVILNIEHYLEYNNLFGATDIQVTQVEKPNISFDYLHNTQGFSNLFSESHYGGDQSDVPNFITDYLSNQTSENLTINNKKAELMVNLIRNIFPNATDIEVINLAKSYAESGCMYMAVANAYITYISNFENGSDMFRNAFGYDLMTSDGNTSSYNVEALALDIFLRKVSKYNGDISLATANAEGVSMASFVNDIVSFFNERGSNLEFYVSSASNSSNAENYLLTTLANYQNMFHILSSSGFDLRLLGDANTNPSLDRALQGSDVEGNVIQNIGGHAMFITGLSDSGQLEVSSWGLLCDYIADNVADRNGHTRIISLQFSQNQNVNTVLDNNTNLDVNTSMEKVNSSHEMQFHDDIELASLPNQSYEDALSDLQTYRRLNNLSDDVQNREIDSAEQYLIDRVNEAKKIEFLQNDVQYNQHTQSATSHEHISQQEQQFIINYLNESMRNGQNTFQVASTIQLSSNILEQIENLDDLRITVLGGFADSNGKLKPQYNDMHYLDRITYTGTELLYIIREIEYLESKIDMDLPIVDRARQIYEIVSREFNYSDISLDYDEYNKDTRIHYSDGTSNGVGHRISASLRGITSYNIFNAPGIVCAGYSQLYYELCNRAGVPCEYIRGTAYMADGRSGGHAWNVVIGPNNEIIPVDTTWHSSGGLDWFGASERFASSHVAGRNEYYTNYAPILSDETRQRIDSIVYLTNKARGEGSGLFSLAGYLATGRPTFFTRTNDVRSIASTLTQSEVQTYLYSLNDEQRVTAFMDCFQFLAREAFGDKNGDRIFDNYIYSNGNIEAIQSQTNQDSVNMIRNFVSNYISRSDYELYRRLRNGGY